MKSLRKAFRKGFSLIELSIVLIIIGLLMAAIMKGKDLIRSAEMKKFYNTFVKAWELAYTQYYDRTGIPLGGPLYTNDTQTNKVVKLSDFVGADKVLKNNAGDVLTDFVLRDPKTIVTRVRDVGIELPNTGLDAPYKYRITFTDAPYSTVWITFGSDPVRKDEKLRVCLEDNCTNIATVKGSGDNRGNFMIMVNVPYDVAAQIDRIIDGRADGSEGNVVCIANYDKEKDGISTDIIDYEKVKDYAQNAGCEGTLKWGTSNKPYVTLMYRFGI